MEFPKGKHAWMVKIGEKGQFVIPKEAREMFDLHPGSTVLVLADEEKGIAIPSKKVGQSMMAQVFQTAQKEELL